MTRKFELTQKEIFLLEKIYIEVSLGFLHLQHNEKSILLKDIREIKIGKPNRSLFQKSLRIINYLWESNFKNGFDGTRPDNIKTIDIYLFNEEIISYDVKNIDLISTSKLFKKLVNSNFINNTSVNNQS